MAKLLVHESAGVREFDLVDAEVHIGRELDNSLRLADPSISRHHCMLRRTPGGFEISDLQSSNGVLINGSRVQSSPLRDGDRITLGQIQLSFSDPAPVGATVAVNRDMVPPAPQVGGTVRMSADQMAAIHGGGATTPIPDLAPEPPPTPAPAATTKMPAAPPPAPKVPETPAFGQFTNPGLQTEEPQGFFAKLMAFFKRG